MIRELKIWQVARSESDISLYRFSSAIPSIGRNNLNHYFRFSSGNEIYAFKDAITERSINSQGGSNPPVTYSFDSGLTVCTQGYFFNG